MIHLVTFADKSMEHSSWLCAESSKRHGVETHARYNPGNISHLSAVKNHPAIFTQPDDPRRAWGWWAWKPLIISAELAWLPEGSTLIYSDAGVEFIDNVSHIIERMDQDIFLFGNMYEHLHWCKMDIIQNVAPGMSLAPYRKQVQASVIFFRVNDKTKAFIKEWLDWCLFENGRLIDDSPSRTPNHPEFKESRHDQAILTTMAYRDGYKLHWWPASYNDGQFVYPRGEYPDEGYPVMFNHHRRRNHEWEQVA